VAIVLPGLRLPAALLILAVAGAGIGAAAFAGGDRTLVWRHTFAGFEGMSHEPSPVHFATGTVTRPGWQWPLPFAGFAALWAGLLLLRRHTGSGRPFVLPVAFAWTAAASWIGMQALAAPAAVVQPFGVDRFLLPAGVALAILLARTRPRLPAMLALLCFGVVLQRLPVAVFSKLASDLRWGTNLDVTPVTKDVVNPLSGLLFDPPLEAGSPAQQFWLIWAEHVFGYPAFYLLSLFGIALGLTMYYRHAEVD
jgi:hypothetical protein